VRESSSTASAPRTARAHTIVESARRRAAVSAPEAMLASEQASVSGPQAIGEQHAASKVRSGRVNPGAEGAARERGCSQRRRAPPRAGNARAGQQARGCGQPGSAAACCSYADGSPRSAGPRAAPEHLGWLAQRTWKATIQRARVHGCGQVVYY
jgi:hypothetical protein